MLQVQAEEFFRLLGCGGERGHRVRLVIASQGQDADDLADRFRHLLGLEIGRLVTQQRLHQLCGKNMVWVFIGLHRLVHKITQQGASIGRIVQGARHREHFIHLVHEVQPVSCPGGKQLPAQLWQRFRGLPQLIHQFTALFVQRQLFRRVLVLAGDRVQRAFPQGPERRMLRSENLTADELDQIARL